MGVLDQEGLCRSCEEEAKAWRDTCMKCNKLVKENEIGLQ